ncbi:MAG: Flp family type IVb pilin [Proteobacteria bacterium]|nr:Flp family type IVb pilin [Pseudomonadota bacterium]
MFTQFIADEDGSTAVEYALVAALLAIVVISALRLVGTRMNVMYTDTIGGALPS